MSPDFRSRLIRVILYIAMTLFGLPAVNNVGVAVQDLSRTVADRTIS